MFFRKFAKWVYTVLNHILGKYGFIIERKGEYDFSRNCCFEPYDVEYQSSEDNIGKMLSHIGEVWSNYGQGEAYYSVATWDKYLNKNLDKDMIEDFYETGKSTISQIETTLRRCGELYTMSRENCMEYGCGVGRITIHLADMFHNVTGLDISMGHLKIAQERIDHLGLKNITLQHVRTVNNLSNFVTKYDFIFSVIVLQHNPPPIIAIIIDNFFKSLNTNGIAMFQVPVQLINYKFSVSDYLYNMDKYDKMEAHMLPQNVILQIARNNGCYPLEIHNDAWDGNPSNTVSQTFVFKKIG